MGKNGCIFSFLYFLNKNAKFVCLFVHPLCLSWSNSLSFSLCTLLLSPCPRVHLVVILLIQLLLFEYRWCRVFHLLPKHESWCEPGFWEENKGPCLLWNWMFCVYISTVQLPSLGKAISTVIMIHTMQLHFGSNSTDLTIMSRQNYT